jgi:molecular chaperone IbpA
MNAIDLTPLYRNTIGFDRLASLLSSSLEAKNSSQSYPPYNIEVYGENEYAITLAVAGFAESELAIDVENGVLTISGKKESNVDRQYLHHGIATRSFERKFNLADFVEVAGADLAEGLLTIKLLKEIPEAMKAKVISINNSQKTLEKT